MFPSIRIFDNRNPALAPPNGTVFVNGRNPPPLFEIRNADEGMLLPAPSVRAAADVAKKAYTETDPMLGRRVHDVVAVMAVLPGLFGLPAVKVKFTAFAESVTVTDS